jgi:hypothetical protein
MSDNSVKNKKIALGILRSVSIKSREIRMNDYPKQIFSIVKYNQNCKLRIKT